MAKDLLLNSEDIDIANGDFNVGNSDVQHQLLLLATDKGEWKQNPTVAVGLFNYIDDEEPAAVLRAISEALTEDGCSTKSVSRTKDNKINIDGRYRD